MYPSVLVSAIPFVFWDIFATWRGHWSFNSKYVLGMNFVNLPVEELLFFMFIPQGCILLWAAMQKHKDNRCTFWESLKKHIFDKSK